MYKKYFFMMAFLLSKSIFAEENVLMPLGFEHQSVTRDVAEYTMKERDLMTAIQTNKEDTLADDFEVWTNSNNDWQSKSEWLKEAKQQTHFNPQNLSVRFMDDFAIVSFSTETHTKKHQKTSVHFIVDIWRKSTQKLAVRYISNDENALSIQPIRKF